MVTIGLLTAACGGTSSPQAAGSPTNGVICSGFNLTTAGTLTVSTYDGEGLPDVNIVNGQLGGLEGALLNGFAKDCKLKISIFQTQFASQILAVQQHKVDVGTDIFWTPTRSKVIYYTAPYNVADHAALFTLKSLNYQGVSSAKTVGTVVGFVWASYLQSALGANAKLYPDQTTGVTAMLNGQLDGWVNGLTSLDEAPILSNNKDKITDHLLKAGDFGMPESAVTNSAYQMVACDNKGLAAAIDSEMAKQVADGTWAQVRAQLNVTVPIPAVKQPAQGC
jgi:ABC-type amino acid transport substrate-binding protein